MWKFRQPVPTVQWSTVAFTFYRTCLSNTIQYYKTQFGLVYCYGADPPKNLLSMVWFPSFCITFLLLFHGSMRQITPTTWNMLGEFRFQSLVCKIKLYSSVRKFVYKKALFCSCWDNSQEVFRSSHYTERTEEFHTISWLPQLLWYANYLMGLWFFKLKYWENLNILGLYKYIQGDEKAADSYWMK